MKLIALMLFFATALLAEHPSSFENAKRAMYDVWQDHASTFYCDCEYDRSNKGNMVKRESCGYSPRNEFTSKGKPNVRARRTEAEHVVPAENFFRQLPCYREAKKLGKNARNYCYENDGNFRTFHDDPINLVPVIGELNADRSNFRYGALEPSVSQYGECRFEVDIKGRKAYIKDDIKGDVARIYFYISSRYGMKISSNDQRILEVWNKQDPIDAWEEERVRRIERYYH